MRNNIKKKKKNLKLKTIIFNKYAYINELFLRKKCIVFSDMFTRFTISLVGDEI